MKLRDRQSIPPIKLRPEDSISVTYTDEDGVKHVLIDDTVDREILCNEAMIFDLEPGDLPGVIDGIGGALVQSSKAEV